MHLILFVLRLLFGRDFLRSEPRERIALRLDGRVEYSTEESGSMDVRADRLLAQVESWLTFRIPPRQFPRRAAESAAGRSGPPAPPPRQ
jgi:hypothetical protein